MSVVSIDPTTPAYSNETGQIDKGLVKTKTLLGLSICVKFKEHYTNISWFIP